MPNGDKVNFPDAMPPDQIKGLIASKFPDEVSQLQPKDNFFQRVGSDFQTRYDQAQTDKARMPQQGSALTGLNMVGGAAGFGFDVLGEGLKSAATGINTLGFGLPGKAIKGAAQLAGQLPSIGGGTIGETIPQEIDNLSQKYGEFQQGHPILSRALESAGNIAMIAAPVKTPEAAAETTSIGKAGNFFTKMGENKAANKRSTFIDDLIRPKQTAMVREEQVARTSEGGLLNKKIIQPSKKEAEIAAEVSNIESVGKHKTLQGNYNLIQSEVGKEAERLKGMLAANDVYFPKKEVRANLKSVAQKLQESPLITGDAAVSADKILAKMDSFLDEMPKSSASNLLEARKKLDQWAKKQKGGAIFDPAGRDTAMSIALREIRTATNDFIDTKATNVPVKQSLKRQSNLYGAMENIAPKAADEADNAVKRLAQGVLKSIPLKGEIAQAIGGLAGVAGVGTLAHFASPLTAGIGATGYGLYKAGTAAGTQKNLGRLLNLTDRAIREAKDQAVLKQMRADRAVLIEMIKNSPSGNGKSRAQSRTEQQYQETNQPESTSSDYMQNAGKSQ